MPKQPTTGTPDEYGRLRVRDNDTGHERTIHAAEFGHGNYVVLGDPASDVCGDPVPPKLATARHVPAVATPEPLSEPTNRGQQADRKKENTDD